MIKVHIEVTRPKLPEAWKRRAQAIIAKFSGSFTAKANPWGNAKNATLVLYLKPVHAEHWQLAVELHSGMTVHDACRLGEECWADVLSFADMSRSDVAVAVVAGQQVAWTRYAAAHIPQAGVLVPVWAGEAISPGQLLSATGVWYVGVDKRLMENLGRALGRK